MLMLRNLFEIARLGGLTVHGLGCESNAGIAGHVGVGNRASREVGCYAYRLLPGRNR